MPLIYFFCIEESDVYYVVMHVIMKIRRTTKNTTLLKYFQNLIENIVDRSNIDTHNTQTYMTVHCTSLVQVLQ